MSDEYFEPETTRIVGRIAVDTIDAHAVARNVATNGRLFAAMLFIANLWAFIDGRGAMHWKLAMGSALIVGLSHLAEVMPLNAFGKRLASHSIIALAVMVFVRSFIV